MHCIINFRFPKRSFLSSGHGKVYSISRYEVLVGNPPNQNLKINIISNRIKVHNFQKEKDMFCYFTIKIILYFLMKGLKFTPTVTCKRSWTLVASDF